MDEYFKQRTDERLERIEEKIDNLFSFKWQIIGGSLGLSSLLSIVIAIATIYFLRTK